MADPNGAPTQADLDGALARLKPRFRFFVEEYLVDFNGTQAAIRAGYSAATATSIGSELLARPDISDAVETAKAVRIARTRYGADKVIAEMSVLAHSDITHYAIDDRGEVTLAPGAPPDAMKAVQSIKKKIRHGKDGEIEYDVELRLWDKPTPLKLMGRHVGLFPDRVEVTGKDGAELRAMSTGELAAEAARLAAEAARLAEGKNGEGA